MIRKTIKNKKLYFYKLQVINKSINVYFLDEGYHFSKIYVKESNNKQ